VKELANGSLAFMAQVKLIKDRSGKPVRPAFYSDNFVSLLPDEERLITVETLVKPAATGG